MLTCCRLCSDLCSLSLQLHRLLVQGETLLPRTSLRLTHGSQAFHTETNPTQVCERQTCWSAAMSQGWIIADRALKTSERLWSKQQQSCDHLLNEELERKKTDTINMQHQPITKWKLDFNTSVSFILKKKKGLKLIHDNRHHQTNRSLIKLTWLLLQTSPLSHDWAKAVSHVSDALIVV